MITVKLFARLEELVGTHTLEWNETEKEVSTLLTELEARYQLNLDSVMVAVNEEYVERNTSVKSGDTVALIPPVSGG